MDKGQFDFWFEKKSKYTWAMLNVCREELSNGNPVPVTKYENVMRLFYPAYQGVIFGQMRASRESYEMIQRELAAALNYKLIDASLYNEMSTMVQWGPPITPQCWTPDSFGPQEENKLAKRWGVTQKPGKPKDPPAPFSLIELE